MMLVNEQVRDLATVYEGVLYHLLHLPQADHSNDVLLCVINEALVSFLIDLEEL